MYAEDVATGAIQPGDQNDAVARLKVLHGLAYSRLECEPRRGRPLVRLAWSAVRVCQRGLNDADGSELENGHGDAPDCSHRTDGRITIGTSHRGGKRMAVAMTTVQKWIEAKAGSVAAPYSARKGSPPVSIMYKVANKIFAILALRGDQSVILKCDPHLIPMLREQYSGVGHRSHLDRRLWINVTLDADVPGKEIKRWISMSYDLVCANLTAKEKAKLRG
jgi:predicted DNA-binding protein (MmcQ/YjbR family)